MIPSSLASLESAQWQRDLAAAISDPLELLATLGLSPDRVGRVDLGELDGFPLRVTRYFAGLMRHGDPHDPLLAQVLPTTAERLATAGYKPDPVGDLSALRDHGVLQKYRGRALTVTTGACAVHCRYCFRRHFPYSEANPLGSGREVAINYLQYRMALAYSSSSSRMILADFIRLHRLEHFQHLLCSVLRPYAKPKQIETCLQEVFTTSPWAII